MQAKSLHWQAHIVKSYRYSRAKIQIEGKFQMFLYIAELHYKCNSGFLQDSLKTLD